MTLQVAEPIVPFWNRLREIARYPLHGEALVTIGMLAVCRLLTLIPVLGWLIGLAIWVGVYKYGFEVLRASANGRLEPPPGGLSINDGLGVSAIYLQAGFVLFNVGGYLLLGPLGGVALSILLALGFPGAIMSLALDENLLHALNPATWLQIMARLGRPYFVAVALCLLINTGSAGAQAVLLPFLPVAIGVVGFYFLAYYALIATFHLMGYLIYQYHEELGYSVEQQESPRAVGSDSDQLLLDRSAELVRAGKPEAATDLLREQLHASGGSDALHTQYRKLLRLADNKDELLRHGREYLSVLLAQDQDKRAVDLARECVDLDPAFAPAQAEQVTRVAHKAAQLGQTRTAILLLSGFHRRYPKSPDIPQNYLLAARLLHERMGEDEPARALLLQLRSVYPQHPLLPDIEAQLAAIDSMAPPQTTAGENK